MKNHDIKQEAVEIVRETVRQGRVIQNADVLDYIPDVVDSVELDKKYILACVRKELKKKSANPFNAILGLMGLRIVNPDSAIKELDIEMSGSGPSDSKEWLKLNSDKLGSTVEAIADSLAGTEQSVKQSRASSQEQHNMLHDELEKKRADYNKVSTAYKNLMTTVAERIQYILCLNGKDAEKTPLTEQIMELLADIGIDVYWSAENAPLSESAMFTVYKTDAPEKRKMKPCLICNGAVVAKGLKFILAED